MKRIACATLVTMLAVPLGFGTAMAFSSIRNQFISRYPASATSNAGCQICHVNSGGGSPWNPYGFDLLQNGTDFAAIEPLDSDGEGTSNLDEISIGTQPGWCDLANPGCTRVGYLRSGTEVGGGTPPDVPLDPGDVTTSTTTTTTGTTSTTNTTLPAVCALNPVPSCIGPEKGILLVKEKVPGKEKVKVVLKKLVAAVNQSQFGDPVAGTTSYTVCVYDQADGLVGEMVVDRSQSDCGTPPRPCWKAISTKGYKYKDKDTTADGILKIIELGGDPGKGKVIVLGKNNASKGQLSLPTGIAPALQNNSKATVQVVSSDADCFGVTTTEVKKADGLFFKALGQASPSGAFLDVTSTAMD
jgi:hypothetical protein